MIPIGLIELLLDYQWTLPAFLVQSFLIET